MALAGTIIGFVVSLLVSAVVIYFTTRAFGETEGFGTAVLAALIGAIIYAAAYSLLGTGILVSIIAGIAWLIALGSLYKIGWVRATGIAVVIWVIVAIVDYILPTVTGPL